MSFVVCTFGFIYNTTRPLLFGRRLNLGGTQLHLANIIPNYLVFHAGTKWSTQNTLDLDFFVDIDLINIILLGFSVTIVILKHPTQTFDAMELLVRLEALNTGRRKLFDRHPFQ